MHTQTQARSDTNTDTHKKDAHTSEVLDSLAQVSCRLQHPRLMLHLRVVCFTRDDAE